MKDKEAIRIAKKIINLWQGQIDFQKKDEKHYKQFKKTIDDQQVRVDALKIIWNLACKYRDIIDSMTSK